MMRLGHCMWHYHRIENDKELLEVIATVIYKCMYLELKGLKCLRNVAGRSLEQQPPCKRLDFATWHYKASTEYGVPDDHPMVSKRRASTKTGDMSARKLIIAGPTTTCTGGGAIMEHQRAPPLSGTSRRPLSSFPAVSCWVFRPHANRTA